MLLTDNEWELRKDLIQGFVHQRELTKQMAVSFKIQITQPERLQSTNPCILEIQFIFTWVNTSLLGIIIKAAIFLVSSSSFFPVFLLSAKIFSLGGLGVQLSGQTFASMHWRHRIWSEDAFKNGLLETLIFKDKYWYYLKSRSYNCVSVFCQEKSASSNGVREQAFFKFWGI